MINKTIGSHKFTIFIAIIFGISVIFLASIVVVGNQTKNRIRENLEPIITELKEDSGAESVSVGIYVGPSYGRSPWDEEYHIFLTAKMADLRRISEKDIFNILANDNIENAKRARGYYGDKDDYSWYTRSVTDGMTDTRHPVYVTLSDGNLEYSLNGAGWSSADMVRLGNKDAYAVLRPHAQSQAMSIASTITVSLFLILMFLIFKAVQKNKKFKEPKQEKLLSVNPKQDEPSKAEKKQKRQKILRISTVSVVAIAIIAIAVVKFVVIPTNKYNEATALKEAGDVDSAYDIFAELGRFKDSNELCNQIDYLRAAQLILDGQNKEAYLLLSTIDDYEDSRELMNQLEEVFPHLSILLSAPGDIVTLGEYEQDNNQDNGKEPIEWIVLYNENGDVYMLSKYVLDAQQFNNSNVNECSLDDWLKTTFSQNAFESVEDDIITRVGILEERDISNYHMTKEQIIAEYTKYALGQDPSGGYASGLMWWVIEDTLTGSGGDVCAPVVWENGDHGPQATKVTYRCGVRPAVWLFADPDGIPVEPVFDGSAPKQYRPTSGSGTKCAICGGTGFVRYYYGSSDLEAWLSGHDSYTLGKCTSCGGSGRD